MENCTCKRPDLQMIDDALYCLSCGYYATQKDDDLINSNDRANYHYKPLQSSRSIRLVRLQSGRRAQAIKCEIFHTTLYAYQPFEALSYTWGDSTVLKRIETPEGCIAVIANCFAALEDLRYENQDRTLWIDAICINQKSNLEKNHQVPLMNKIYAAASQVLIYIGRDPRPGYSEQFFGLWRESNLNFPDLQREISTFLSFPWWSRAWILQEVAVARKAILVWGSATLEWGLFSAAQVTKRGFEPIDLDGNIPPVFMFSGNDPKPLNDIYSLMYTARISRCSEPRDKIYALVGLLGDHVVHTLVADYDISLQALYVDFAVHLIKSYGNLDVLCFLGRETIPDSVQLMKQMRRHRDRIVKLKSEMESLETALTTRASFGMDQSRTTKTEYSPPNMPLDSTTTDYDTPLHADNDVAPETLVKSFDRTIPSIEAEISSIQAELNSGEEFLHQLSEGIKMSTQSWTNEHIWNQTEQQDYRTGRDSEWALSAPETLLPYSSDSFPSWVPQLDFVPKLKTIPGLYLGPSSSSYTTRLCAEASAHASPALKIRIYTVDSVQPYDTSTNAVDESLANIHFPKSVVPYIHGDINIFAKGRKVMFARESWIICSHDVHEGDQVCFIGTARKPFVLRLVEQNEHGRSFRLLGECYYHAGGHGLSRLFRQASLASHWENGDSQWENVCLV